MVTAFETFRSQYPQGCLVSDLITIQDGQYVVRTAVVNDGQTLATGLAASVDVQIAEDQARARAIALLGITASATTNVATSVSTMQPAVVTPPPAQPSKSQSAKSQPSQPHTAPALKIVQPSIQSDKPPKESKIQQKPIEEMPIEEMPIDEMPTDQPIDQKQPIEALPLEEMPIESEEDLGPPIDVIEESAEPIDESLAPEDIEPMAAPAKVSAATIALKNFNASAQPVDLSDVIAQTDVELTRLGWTSAQGREYLEKTYRKRSRQQLTDEELMSFLLYLEDQ